MLKKDVPKMTPTEYLEYLQRETYSFGGTPESLVQRFTYDMFKDMLESSPQAKSWAEMACKDQGLTINQLYEKVKEFGDFIGDRRGNISPLIEPLLKVLTADEQYLLSKIPVGHLHSNDVNAFAIKVPGGGKVIAFDGMVLQFFDKLVKIMLSLNYIDQDPPEIGIQKGVCQCIRVIFDFFITREPALLDAVTLSVSEKKRWYAHTIMNAIGVFIIAHEFAHAKARHLDDSRTTVAALQNRLSIEIYSKSQRQELEADTLGVDMLYRRYRASHSIPDKIFMSTPALASVPLMFLILDAVEDIIGIRSTSHPPSKKRFANIMDAVGSEIPKSLKGFLDQERYFLDICRRIVIDYKAKLGISDFARINLTDFNNYVQKKRFTIRL